MKICLISPVPPPYGGISHWTMLMHRHVADSNVDVDLIQVDTAPRWRAIHDKILAKQVIGGGLQLLRDYLIFLGVLLKRPDIIHLTTSGGMAVVRDMVISITAKLLRVPLVYHLRFGRVPEIAEANTMEWRLLANVMRLARVVIAIAPKTADTISFALPNVDVEYVPNPIDQSKLPASAKNNGGHKIALFVGWVLATKGIEELVRSWSELNPDDWQLLIVGPGDDTYQRDLLKRYAPEHLNFVGELEHAEAMRLMARCDLFVLPSYTEGFPNVILEAMALGKPIIATDVGAIDDMLAGGCGVLIEPRNVEALKSQLALLINDEILRYELGEKALQKISKTYTIEIIFARYIQIWQRLCLGNMRNAHVV